MIKKKFERRVKWSGNSSSVCIKTVEKRGSEVSRSFLEDITHNLAQSGCRQLRVSAAFERSDVILVCTHSSSLSLSLSLTFSADAALFLSAVLAAVISLVDAGACVQRSGRTIWNIWRWGSGRGWKESSERPAEMDLMARDLHRDVKTLRDQQVRLNTH